MILSIFSLFLLLLNQPLRVGATDGNVEKDDEKQVFIFLRQAYLDGETSETVISIRPSDCQPYIMKYINDGWELKGIIGDRIILEKRVNDISPLLKSNGFFGITEDGTLSIFDGRPDENKVIHSFFQIDVQKLETKRQMELQEGIRIRTKDTYIQVIQAFQPYSISPK